MYESVLAAILPRAVANDCALVLTAAGIPYEARHAGGLVEVWVAAPDAERARTEMSAYLRENIDHVRPPPELPRHPHALAGVVAYALVLLGVTGAALFRLGDRSWVDRGVLDIGLFERGEWWRVFTALTLHADLGHLLANLAFGILFAWPASQFLGVGVAWLAIVLGAGAAYALDMLIHPPSHTVLGASTAVFVALGLTSAFSWRRRFTRRATSFQRAAPLVAGVALLAFTGAGGERTDLLAHLLGFGVGVVTGIVLAHSRMPVPGQARPQRVAGTLALGVLASAWLAALV
jgi:membrane associated rhomboid family serine protease